MGLRITIKGLEKPYHALRRTITRDTTLNAHELRHLLPPEHHEELHALFPFGSGIGIRIQNSVLDEHGKHIALIPEQHMVSEINTKPMPVGEKYRLKKGDVQILKIGNRVFRAEIHESDF